MVSFSELPLDSMVFPKWYSIEGWNYLCNKSSCHKKVEEEQDNVLREIYQEVADEQDSNEVQTDSTYNITTCFYCHQYPVRAKSGDRYYLSCRTPLCRHFQQWCTTEVWEDRNTKKESPFAYDEDTIEDPIILRVRIKELSLLLAQQNREILKLKAWNDNAKKVIDGLQKEIAILNM